MTRGFFDGLIAMKFKLGQEQEAVMATKIRMEMERIRAFCLCAYRLGINPLPSIREQYGIPVKFAYDNGEELSGFTLKEYVPTLYVILDNNAEDRMEHTVRLVISGVKPVGSRVTENRKPIISNSDKAEADRVARSLEVIIENLDPQRKMR